MSEPDVDESGAAVPETRRLVVVTGASRGLGLAAARQFADGGDRVVLAARSADALSAAVEDIRADGGAAWAWAGDLQTSEACNRLIDWVSTEVGEPDVLVLAAGVGHWGPTVEVEDADWQQTQRINVDSVFYLTRAALQRMLPREKGHLVFVSSVMARRGVPNMSGYAASKAAVATFAESLAVEVKPAGVKVTVIYPGTTATTMRDHQAAQGRPMTLDITDPARQLSPEDVAEAIVWSTTLSERVYPTGVYLEPRGV